MVIMYVLLGSNLIGAERSEPSDVSVSLTTWCPLVQEVYSNVLLNLADVGDNETVPVFFDFHDVLASSGWDC